MANAFTEVYIHAIFGVKTRRKIIIEPCNTFYFMQSVPTPAGMGKILLKRSIYFVAILNLL
jgi:hypothetical protein